MTEHIFPGQITFSSMGTGLIHSDGSGELTSSLAVNADISPTAAITYGKLDLANSIVNADIATGAAIAYSKLVLTGAVVDADLASGVTTVGAPNNIVKTTATGSITLTTVGSVIGFPAMTQAQRNAIVSPQAGWAIWNTTLNTLDIWVVTANAWLSLTPV